MTDDDHDHGHDHPGRYQHLAIERYRRLGGNVEWGEPCCGSCYYAFRPNEVVVDDRGLDVVREIVDSVETLDSPSLAGLRLVAIGGPRDALQIAHVARSFDPAALVAPNYVLRPAEHKGGYFPDDLPVPVPAASMRLRAGKNRLDGDQVTVGVVDTGVRRDHPWWADGSVTGDEEHPPADPADIELGHGTFVAGVIKQVAPRARVVVKGLGPVANLTDWAVANAMVELATRDGAAVINVSLATCAPPGVPPLPMEAAVRTIEAACGDDVVIVAAAGNDRASDPPYPAGLPGVVAVGATSGDAAARYSNHGPWVDVCAEGTWKSAYFDGDVPVFAGTPSAGPYEGFARWRGSSFSSAVVTGRIARRRAAGARTAGQALRDVRAGSPTRLPGLGRYIRKR